MSEDGGVKAAIHGSLGSFQGAKAAIEAKIQRYEEERRGMLARVAEVQLGRDEAEGRLVALRQQCGTAERRAREAEAALEASKVRLVDPE